jgi:hypothetical protein
MFILLWMYLGGTICALAGAVEVMIVDHYRLRNKMLLMIILSLVWPFTYLANIFFVIRDIIRRNKTEY